MDNLELYERYRTVPEEAKKKITGGRISGMTDINPMWRIKKLTEEFGPCGIGWYYTVTNRWLEKSGDEVAAFVDLELYVKNGEGWSMPIVGNGGSKFATKEKGGIFVSDECYKMATTDALSVSCKQLGIGADVYFDRDTTKYETAKKTGEENRIVNAEEIKNLEQAAVRTGMELGKAIENLKKYGVECPSIKNLPVSIYTKWMVKMASVDSIPSKTPDNVTFTIPEEIPEQLPFE